MIDQRVQLLPKQLDFVTDTSSRFLLYSGAFGAGKSRALCYRVLCRAIRPGAREALVRKHLVTLKATTLRTLLEPDGNLPPVLPPGTYSHNKSEKIIRIRGGGEIIYFGLDDPQKVGSHNLTGAGVDEKTETTEVDFRWLRGRIRGSAPGLNRSIYGACNPGSPSHYLAKMFGLVPGHSAKSGCRAIRTNVFDNKFLPQDYIDDLASFVGLARRRYVEGLWVQSEGLVYSDFDRDVMVQSMPRGDLSGRIVASLDLGFRNPTSLLVGIGNNERLHIPFEWYAKKQREEQIRHKVREVYNSWKFDVIRIDPSAAQLIHALCNDGIPAAPANNKVFEGILATQNYMQTYDSQPMFTIDPSCTDTIRELETYEWKTRPGSGKSEYLDEPVKANDHSMDALRYMVQDLKVGSTVGTW